MVFVDIYICWRLTYLGYIVVVALHVLEMRLGWGSSIPASVSSSWNSPHAQRAKGLALVALSPVEKKRRASRRG